MKKLLIASATTLLLITAGCASSSGSREAAHDHAGHSCSACAADKEHAKSCGSHSEAEAEKAGCTCGKHDHAAHGCPHSSENRDPASTENRKPDPIAPAARYNTFPRR